MNKQQLKSRLGDLSGRILKLELQRAELRLQLAKLQAEFQPGQLIEWDVGDRTSRTGKSVQVGKVHSITNCRMTDKPLYRVQRRLRDGVFSSVLTAIREWQRPRLVP